MLVIQKVCYTLYRVELWQQKIVSLEVFYLVVEVTYHHCITFVVVRVLGPDLAVVSFHRDWGAARDI